MLTVEQLTACGLEKVEASKIAEAVNRILEDAISDCLLVRNFTLRSHPTPPVRAPSTAL